MIVAETRPLLAVVLSTIPAVISLIWLKSSDLLWYELLTSSEYQTFHLILQIKLAKLNLCMQYNDHI